MFRSLRIPLLCVMSLLLIVWLVGCSDSTEPSPAGSDRSEILGEGTLDPDAGTFVLKTFDNPPPHDGPPIRIQLVGSNLVVDSSGSVSIDVALRNLHYEPLFAPAVVWLSAFVPSQVEVLNPDLVMGPADPDSTNPSGATHYGFNYDEMFGDDGVLGPEETSESKTWTFGNHNGGSFSFAARAEFGMVPDLPRLGGFCWFDDNYNGIPDPGEQGLGVGLVEVTFPDGQVGGVMVGPDGHYSLPIEEPGLYQLFFDSMMDCYYPMHFSTPNPLEVMVVPGPDGQPASFLDANFGIITNDPQWPVIQFTDLPPDSLQIGDYQLMETTLDSPVSLSVHVAFSGCGPGEPFSLFMSGGFMESFPLQANLVLRKDFQSDCDAYWDEEIRFDLGPLVDRYLQAYGDGGDGVLLLNLHDFSGDVHQLELILYPPDDPDPLTGAE